ncbi:MAG: bifunctional 4-hydroxy-2-oxoglutarate aldolase/2-dehydro-3-deoxy-phosphogluconate aldolase [Treponema sp.]|jgi:2-dehydro-3-deoxyphosphogluconate aldolase/(4S)-4-hydroxy-2-oxoglutarate aldolase|nr:bifunctional 4-hydroxy-2-oxoglutarate aldolase/2-dehydro-3-deoxy-phosphogluconate aldolase [Treponema sp.]
MMQAILERIGKIGIVPVVVIDDADKAVPLTRALEEGGLPCAEITFRTAQALESLQRIHREMPNFLIGAGTVISAQQADEAVSAGASFIVSPGFNPSVVKHCVDKGIPVVPGCATPSDMEKALELGLKTVKFFPAEQAGGLAYLKAVSAPYTSLTFMPTGGIDAVNLTGYAKFDKVIACGGSWMVNKTLIHTGDFEGIRESCRDAVAILLGFSMVHIGVNTDNSAKSAAEFFAQAFGFSPRETSASVFSNESIEFMNNIGRGTHGHIAIGTNNVERAKFHLENRGVAFDETTARHNTQGKLVFIYLKDEIAGFAVHLTTKA